MLNLVTRGLSARMLRYSLQGAGRGAVGGGQLVGWLEPKDTLDGAGVAEHCGHWLATNGADECNTLPRSPVDGGLVGRVVPQLLFCVLVVHVVAHANELLRQ